MVPPKTEAHRRWSMRDWIWILVVLIGYVTAIAAASANTKMQVQHIQDTKVDKTELSEVEKRIDQRLRNIESMLARIDERFQFSQPANKDG